MAIQNSLSLKTCFELDNDPKNFEFTDTTDYATEGIALSDVVGILKVVGPVGTVYENTNFGSPDIDADVSLIFNTVNLPLDSNSAVLKGDYVVTYTIQVSGAVQPGTYVKTFSYNFNYTQPTVDLDVTIDYFCSKLESTDNTSYPAGTSVTRTHTLTPPVGSGLSPTVGATQVVSASPITTKTWTASITADFEVTQPADSLCIKDEITGTTEREVRDDLNLCTINCCIQKVFDRYNAALANNPTEAKNIYETQLRDTLAAAHMFRTAAECGQNTKAEAYFQDILKFSGCSGDCECSDSETPAIIQPLCAGTTGDTTVVAVSGMNSALSVMANTVGSTTTYTLLFSQALFDKLSNLNADYIVTSASPEITVTPSTDANNNRTYDLSFNGASVSTNSNISRVQITLSKSVLPAIALDKDTTVGTLLQTPTVVSDNIGGTYNDWASSNNCFTINGYSAAAGGEDAKPFLQVTKLVDDDGNDITCDDVTTVRAEILSVDYSTPEIKFRFAGGEGYPRSNADLANGLSVIELSLNLIV